MRAREYIRDLTANGTYHFTTADAIKAIEGNPAPSLSAFFPVLVLRVATAVRFNGHSVSMGRHGWRWMGSEQRGFFWHGRCSTI